MVSKVIGVFLLVMLHASADPYEATKVGKAMAKAFAPAAGMHPGVTSGARHHVGTAPSHEQSGATVWKTLADLEKQNDDMKVAYQHLRARIQSMPQADNQALSGSAGSFGWLAGFIASVGLAASVGVAAVRKYSGQGQHGSESTSDSQISLQPQRAGLVTMRTLGSSIKPGDIGTTKPIGVYDPLNILTKNPEKYRRWQEMEIKHGRIAMLACTHVFVTANYKWDGYCSYLSFPPLKFADIPAGTLASWEALPQAGWAQIVALVAILDNSLFRQDPDREPGDTVGDRIPWVRYKDPAVKEFKLNAERNNGRAAMMGIIGMMIHESLTGNPIWPLTFVDKA